MSKINLNKSTPSKFNLVFSKLPGDSSVNEARKFTLNIFGTIVPSITLDVSKNSYLGWEVNNSTSNMKFSDWTFEFNVDEEFDNWTKIFNWMTLINDNKEKMYDKEFDYLTDCSLMILDDYNKLVKTINFKNVFPSSLETISFNKREGEGILESSCTLNFDYFVVN